MQGDQPTWVSTWQAGYNHNTSCRSRILEAMEDDPEYRQLVHKHVSQREAGDVELLTEAQIAEKRKNVLRAMHSIEQRERQDRGNLEEPSGTVRNPDSGSLRNLVESRGILEKASAILMKDQES